MSGLGPEEAAPSRRGAGRVPGAEHSADSADTEPKGCAGACCGGCHTPSLSWPLADMPSETETRPTPHFCMEDCMFLVCSYREDNKAQKREGFVWGTLITHPGPSRFVHFGGAARPLHPPLSTCQGDKGRGLRGPGDPACVPLLPESPGF